MGDEVVGLSIEKTSTGSRCAKGFTLVEVLVALLILSIGLLGLAALQAQALKDNHSSFMRSRATFLASDILDRMHADRTRAIAGNYDISLKTTKATTSLPQVVQDDLNDWKSNLKQLPDGQGSIAINGNMVTIVVQWQDDSASTPTQFTVQTQL